MKMESSGRFSVFSATSRRPASIGIVVDTSGSMSWKLAAAEARASATSSEEGF